VDRLKKALGKLLEDRELAVSLAAVLADASGKGIVSHAEVEGIVSEDPKETLLLGSKLRLLLPTRVVKSGAWEDRTFLCKLGESYQLPNVVQRLAQNASKTGC
jgi:hypothetical protein